MTVKFSTERPLTDSEEAEIQKMIASDPDAPELTDEQLARGKPFAEALPALFESIKRGRGRPLSDQTKVPVTIRLDADVVERFKSTGPGWQTRMNNILSAVSDMTRILNEEQELLREHESGIYSRSSKPSDEAERQRRIAAYKRTIAELERVIGIMEKRATAA